jgi:hypothetical protein
MPASASKNNCYFCASQQKAAETIGFNGCEVEDSETEELQ